MNSPDRAALPACQKTVQVAVATLASAAERGLSSAKASGLLAQYGAHELAPVRIVIVPQEAIN